MVREISRQAPIVSDYTVRYQGRPLPSGPLPLIGGSASKLTGRLRLLVALELTLRWAREQVQSDAVQGSCRFADQCLIDGHRSRLMKGGGDMRYFRLRWDRQLRADYLAHGRRDVGKLFFQRLEQRSDGLQQALPAQVLNGLTGVRD